MEWMEWCQRYTTEKDPSGKPIQTPRIKSSSYSDVAVFRKRLSVSRIHACWERLREH